MAVSETTGPVRFGVESSGRYGGIELETGQYIDLYSLNINEVLHTVLEQEKVIDVLKIDTEGAELRTVEAIDAYYLKFIKKIYLEAHPTKDIYPSMFDQNQYGSVCTLRNKSLR